MNNKKLVFISSPLSGDDIKQNIENAKKYCKYICDNDKNLIPIAPHIYFTEFLNDKDPVERQCGIIFGLELLKQCFRIYVFTNSKFELSNGMNLELQEAKKQGLEIYYIDRDTLKI